MLHQALNSDSGVPEAAIPAIGCQRGPAPQDTAALGGLPCSWQQPGTPLPFSPETTPRGPPGRLRGNHEPGKLPRSSPHQFLRRYQLLPPPRGQQRRLPGCLPAAVPAVTLLPMRIPTVQCRQ